MARLFEQCTSNGNALLFAAGKLAPAFAAKGIQAAPGYEFFQVGTADDLIQGLLRENTEHRNIIPDGGGRRWKSGTLFCVSWVTAQFLYCSIAVARKRGFAQ